MDLNTVLNTDIKQKDPSRAVVIAISHDAVFDLKEEQESKAPAAATGVLSLGPGFPFVKAVQRVNEKLLEKNPDETLLFDMILLSSKNCPKSQSEVADSVKHYGLEISRFCCCSDENFISVLRSNKVKLFLSTNTDYITKAQDTGVPAALLYGQGTTATRDQLRVLFVGDSLGFSEDVADRLKDEGTNEDQLQSFQLTQSSFEDLVALIGEMRRKFGRKDSPLCACLMTVRSPRNVCVQALKRLRAWGLEVDEAFCLAGAPQSCLLAKIQPHIVYDHGLQYTLDVSALS